MIKSIFRITVLLFVFIGFLSISVPAQTGNKFTAYIEIPAGTNVKWEYDTQTSELKIDQKNGEDRVIQYLPYPGNYGFLIGTLQSAETGGDGDPLDLLLISQTLEKEMILDVIPVAVLEFLDRGEKDDKIIAIPADPELRVINAETFEELNQNYPGVIEIIQTWFLNYKGPGMMELTNTGDEKRALEVIRENSIH